MDESLNRIDDRGTDVGTVAVDIDYEILNHFSRNLYRSASKAVEELVTNGFDALAQRVWSYLPGRFASGALVVWDDGESMDVDDLQHLWWIARSPKGEKGDRVVEYDQGGEARRRALIGKFGIGKLASYTIGVRLTHLCHRNGRYLRVTVDYRGAPRLDEVATGESPPRYRAPIVELSEEEARAYLAELIDASASVWSEAWSAPSWTVAVVDQLKPDVDLPQGRLRRVIGTGMPLREDFRVWVDDEEVHSTLETASQVEWDASTERVVARLVADWEVARNDGEVTGDIAFESDEDPPRVIFPHLGPVSVTVRVFDDSLVKGKRAERGYRSHGYFVRVRDRLINPDDDALFLHEPSFGTYYRSQFVINADGLDAELLADREHIQGDTPMQKELALLQRSLYLEARQEIAVRDEGALKAATTEAVLPFELREVYREPLTALLLREGFGPAVDPSEPKVVAKATTGDDPMVAVTSEGFSVNYAHPLLAELEKRLPRTKTYREAYRVIELFAVADRLLEGYLWDIGVPDETIAKVVKWRDSLLRAMAAKLSGADEIVIEEVVKASYAGDKEFEDALASLFGLIGFEATRHGKSGEKDVLVVAPIGEGHYEFVVEAKGRRVDAKPLANDDADISGAARHRDEAGSSWAVVVAREFAGFQKGDAPAVLGECESVTHYEGEGDDRVATKGVSVATVEAVIELYKAMRSYYYPLTVVPDILWPIEPPVAKLERIRTMQRPTKDFDFVALLQALWTLQSGKGSGTLVPIRTLAWEKPEWKAMNLDEFRRRVYALETLSRGLIRTTGDNVQMLQHPDLVAAQIQAAVAADES